MGKREAYQEMCKKGKDIDGKYRFSFDEIADIIERNMGIPKDEVQRRIRDITFLKSIKDV